MIEYLRDRLSDEDLLSAPKVLRTHCYVQQPYLYDIECLICGTHDITWSEFEGHIWCLVCKGDILIPQAYAGIFGGPIPIGLAEELGTSFDRVGMDGVVVKRLGKQPDEKFNATWVRDEELSKYEKMIDGKLFPDTQEKEKGK